MASLNIKNLFCGKQTSKAEFRRLKRLKSYENANLISNLQTQPELVLLKKISKKDNKYHKVFSKKPQKIQAVLAVKYTPDFVYDLDGVIVFEEIKSEYTKKLRDYPLRRKMMINAVRKYNKHLSVDVAKRYGFDKYIDSFNPQQIVFIENLHSESDKDYLSYETLKEFIYEL